MEWHFVQNYSRVRVTNENKEVIKGSTISTPKSIIIWLFHLLPSVSDN